MAFLWASTIDSRFATFDPILDDLRGDVNHNFIEEDLLSECQLVSALVAGRTEASGVAPFTTTIEFYRNTVVDLNAPDSAAD